MMASVVIWVVRSPTQCLKLNCRKSRVGHWRGVKGRGGVLWKGSDPLAGTKLHVVVDRIHERERRTDGRTDTA